MHMLFNIYIYVYTCMCVYIYIYIYIYGSPNVRDVTDTTAIRMAAQAHN